MRTLITGGTIVTSTGMRPADVLVEGETIAAIIDRDVTDTAPGASAGAFDSAGGTNPAEAGSPHPAPDLDPARVDRVIDASGRFVLPGGVDPHTHLDLPVGQGVVSSDDFETGTIAAACGGTTTIIDFPTQLRGGTLREALDAWHAKAAGRAAIDYAFHVIVCDLSPAVERELDTLVRQDGITSVKLFMAYPDRLMLDDGAIYRAMEVARDLGMVVCLHAENGHVVDALVREALAAGHTAPRDHAATRPPEVEAEAVHRAITMATLARAPLYVVHVSTARAVMHIAAARRHDLPVYGETCPQYLCLDESRYEGDVMAAAKYVMSPPLRPRWMQAWLWDALDQRDLQAVGTDHCPFWLRDKARGRDDFSKMPNGAAGIEHRLALLYDRGVRAGRLSWPRLVDVFATAPARIFGLHPRKGALAPGADADVVVFDPSVRRTVTTATHRMRVDSDPYEGFEVEGAVETVLARGEVVVDRGAWVGRAGRGSYLPRARHDSAVRI
jgi:dihydropyrimidinase